MTARRDSRNDEAFERLAARYERTSEQQIAELDGRLGFNVGARRERARLLKQIGTLS